MLDAAIWKELGAEEVSKSEAFYDALGTLLSRWLLARSQYPEMEAIKVFANADQSKGACALKATEIVHASLFPKLRGSGHQRKTKSKAADRKQFSSDDQIGNNGFFDDAPAILKCAAIEKDVPSHSACLSANEKIPAEFHPSPLAGKVRTSRISRANHLGTPISLQTATYAYQKPGFGISEDVACRKSGVRDNLPRIPLTQFMIESPFSFR
jgi:hypothetical protein